MSRFSGKYDLYDIIEMQGGFENFKGTKLFIGDIMHPLAYTNLKDLIPYYPYIEKTGYYNNKTPEQNKIILSEKSWLDIEEERFGKKIDENNIYRKNLKEELEKAKTE